MPKRAWKNAFMVILVCCVRVFLAENSLFSFLFLHFQISMHSHTTATCGLQLKNREMLETQQKAFPMLSLKNCIFKKNNKFIKMFEIGTSKCGNDSICTLFLKETPTTRC